MVAGAAGPPTASGPGGATTKLFRPLATASAVLAGGRGLASALSAVWLVVLARRLSLPDFGDLAILLASTTILINLSERGLQTQLAIHVVRSGGIDRSALLEALRRRVIASALCAVVNAGLYLAVAHDRNPALPAIAAGSLLGTGVYNTILIAYRATGRSRAEALNETLSRVGVLAVGTLWLGHGGGLVAAVAVYAIADVVSAMVISLTVGGQHVSRLEVPLPDLRLRATAPFALSMMLLTVFYRIDTYLVGWLSGSKQVGVYGAAYRLLDAVGLPVFALGSMVFAHTLARSASDRLRTFGILAGVSVGLTAPVVIASSLAGSAIMRTLFGPHFAGTGDVLTVLMLSAVPVAVAAAGAPIVQPHDGRRFAVLAAAVLVVNVGANGLLIPRHGALGAAYANLLANALFCLGVAALALSQARREDRDARGGERLEQNRRSP